MNSDIELQCILRKLQAHLPKMRPKAFIEQRSTTNRVIEVWFDDRHALVIKRPRDSHLHSGMAACEREAARLLASSSQIAVPRYLPSGAQVNFLAYWRLPLPTLSDLWSFLSLEQRRVALRTLGQLIRELHKIELPNFGRLGFEGSKDLESSFHSDLFLRLLPAVRSCWTEGVQLVSDLLDCVPRVVARANGRAPVFVHGDLFAGNVLCADLRCSGVIDLEAASGNLAESEIARLALLHGPLLGHPFQGNWIAEVLAGYRKQLDPMILRFYSKYHLANLAFHAAATGRPDVANWFKDQAEPVRSEFVRTTRKLHGRSADHKTEGPLANKRAN